MTGLPVDALVDGELTLIGQVAHASNATIVCEATTDERTVRCVYKPIRGEQPLWDFPDGTLAGRERAAYLVSEQLGWGVVPRTVLRDGPFGPGMVQEWIDTPDRHADTPAGLELVDICPADDVPAGFFEILHATDMDGSEVALVHADDPRLQRMAVLDLVINNADRKGGHALEGFDGEVYGVDHGVCLHAENKLRTVLWGWAGQEVPGALVVDMAALVDSLSADFGEELTEHITTAEVSALRDRVKTLIELPVMPRPNGHRPIPWPAF
ncbi:MAG: SCO1664 family protein [Rhodococcus sp.]|nr:SCO1664 family protein [Rhodococcus sp. (in: high G+C Gram-positive bacteria)]